MKNIFKKLFKKQSVVKDSIYKKLKNSSDIEKIFKAFDKHSDNSEIRFVGGCIRKFLKNEKIDDIDLATNVTPEITQKILSENNINFFNSGIDHGTITAVVNDNKYEITSLRRDVLTDGRHARVEFTNDWSQDASRRDFTINSIYSDLEGNLFDPHAGKFDLENGIVKFIGNPDQRIKEDFLRILRYVRFFSDYSRIEHDENLKTIILKNISGIKKISKDRLLNELKKIYKSKGFLNISNNDFSALILTMIFPELKNLKSFGKLNYDALDLFFMKDFIFLLSITIIDETDNVDYFLFKYNLSNNDKNRVKFLKKYIQLINEKNFFTQKNLLKILYLYGTKNLIDLIDLKIFKSKKPSNSLLKVREEFENKDIPIFPIKANTIMKEYNLKEGKELGEKLKKLENIWINNHFYISNKDIEKVIKT